MGFQKGVVHRFLKQEEVKSKENEARLKMIIVKVMPDIQSWVQSSMSSNSI